MPFIAVKVKKDVINMLQNLDPWCWSQISTTPEAALVQEANRDERFLHRSPEGILAHWILYFGEKNNALTIIIFCLFLSWHPPRDALLFIIFLISYTAIGNSPFSTFHFGQVRVEPSPSSIWPLRFHITSISIVFDLVLNV